MSEVKFEPFQKVLVRDENEDEWHADFFSHIYDGIYVCVGHPWKECLPYNDETAHLLGTTDSPTPPEPEFKWGDKVVVRDSDKETWHPAIFTQIIENKFFAILKGASSTAEWKQCRHADW